MKLIIPSRALFKQRDRLTIVRSRQNRYIDNRYIDWLINKDISRII